MTQFRSQHEQLPGSLVSSLSGTDPPRMRHRHKTTEVRAVDLMLPRGETVREETGLGEAIRLRLEREYKILPVVNAQGRLVGVVDRADLLRAIVVT